jgi:hypothetical protein
VLQWAPLSLKQDILDLFNKILDTREVPEIWRYAIIAALYKNKGDPFMPINYRPIVLRSCIAKLFELIILTRMKSKVDGGWNAGEQRKAKQINANRDRDDHTNEGTSRLR